MPSPTLDALWNSRIYSVYCLLSPFTLKVWEDTDVLAVLFLFTDVPQCLAHRGTRQINTVLVEMKREEVAEFCTNKMC